MRIVPVPCLKDNYAYLVIDRGHAAVVDPGEAGPVLAAARAAGVTLDAVWATHHHPDHVGGVPDLVRAIPGLAVIGHEHDRERIPKLTRTVADGDQVELGDEVRATAIHNPGHTLGAVSYWIACPPGETDAVFTGDTLFAAGCGRLFEGTAAQMHASLVRLTSLPPDCRVYFGHEYTAANLRFAAAVEPDDEAIRARIEMVATRRAAGEPTTPSTVASERATNPFVRVDKPSVAAAARAHDPSLGDDADPAAVLAVVRRWKDGFRS
jgi:hydroxyacylglutathione hydrolase